MRKSPSDGNEKKSFAKGKKTGVTGSTSEAPPNLQRKRRNRVNQIEESSGRRKKKNRMQAKSEDQRSMDLISQLPEHVIQHILSHLRCSKDAARTSVLSKKWRDIWASYIILDFDERKFHKQDWKHRFQPDLLCIKFKKKKGMRMKERNELFRNFIDNTMQRRIEQNSCIQKFRLHLTSYSKEQADDVNRWISLASKSKMQELDLHIPTNRNLYYEVPQLVFSCAAITVLRIHGCRLGTCNDIKLPNLQKLSFGKLQISENLIQNLMLGCPLIYDLRLISCIGLKNLVLHSDKLDRVDIHLCHGMEKIEIQSSSLKTFWYHANSSRKCVVNLASCQSLKNLTFVDSKMNDDMFQSHLSNFPVLEHLVLRKCNALQCITITSHQLKTLVLGECAKLKETDIDTPNLLSFEYSGQTHRIPFSSLNPFGLKEAKIYYGCSSALSKGVSNIWFNELTCFLKRFDHSKGLKLVVSSGKNVIIHEDMKDVLVPQETSLKLEIVKSSTSLEDVLNNSLRRWHPKTLSIVSSISSDFPKQVQMKLENREEELSCCKYNSMNKCWRHFLKYAIVEKLADTEKESDWIDLLKTSASVVNQITFFRLKWKYLQGSISEVA
ncbi:F-box/RNI-like superfamily protein [Euphorbia peplus]|nr:F-box/RNI-like superfamily protein [Euphorbia peplus]